MDKTSKTVLNNLENLDVNDYKSIKAFRSDLQKTDTIKDLNFIYSSINKLIEKLKNTEEKDYGDKITIEILECVWEFASLNKSTFSETGINLDDLCQVYIKLICYFKENWNPRVLLVIFSPIEMLKRRYEDKDFVSQRLVKYEILTKAADIFKNCDFLSQKNLNDNTMIDLYDSLLSCFETYASIDTSREFFIQIELSRMLLDHLDQLNKVLIEKDQLKYIKIYVISTIFKLKSEEEINKLTIGNDIVLTITGCIKESVKNATKNEKYKNTRYYTEYTSGDSSIVTNTIDQWIVRLTMIAVNDALKPMIYYTLFDVLPELMKQGNDKEKASTCQLLCQLCFNNNVKQLIYSNAELLNAVKVIGTETNDDSVKRDCQQIIDMVNQTIDKRIASAKDKKIDPTKANHVMISYCHKDKNVCLEINNQLKSKGYKTWIDMESLVTDLRESMAKAIENAYVVLICYSDSYKQSGNCRYEAEYAANLNKNIVAVKVQEKYRPDGWLGLLVSAKLYVDFGKKSDISMAFNNLVKQIEKLSNTDLTRPQSARNITSASRQHDDPRKWSHEEVKKWLLSYNLESLTAVFSKYNGIALKGLWHVQQKDYAEFRSILDKEIEKSQVNVENYEKLSFYELLQSLFT